VGDDGGDLQNGFGIEISQKALGPPKKEPLSEIAVLKHIPSTGEPALMIRVERCRYSEPPITSVLAATPPFTSRMLEAALGRGRQ
jgi:hypothetical protein